MEGGYWPWYRSEYKLKDYIKLVTIYDIIYRISLLLKNDRGAMLVCVTVMSLSHCL